MTSINVSFVQWETVLYRKFLVGTNMVYPAPSFNNSLFSKPELHLNTFTKNPSCNAQAIVWNETLANFPNIGILKR